MEIVILGKCGGIEAGKPPDAASSKAGRTPPQGAHPKPKSPGNAPGLLETCRSEVRPVQRSGAGNGFFLPVFVDIERARLSGDDLGGDDHLLDALQARKLVHRVEQDRLDDGPQAARAAGLLAYYYLVEYY